MSKENKQEGFLYNKLDKSTTSEQEILEVNIENSNKNKIEKDDKQAFEDFKAMYQGVIDIKVLQDYGMSKPQDKDIWEDTAKEMYLASKTYIPTEDIKLSGTLEDKLEEGFGKFTKLDKVYANFLDKAKEELSEEGTYEFRMDQLGISKEEVAEFKNMLLADTQLSDIKYDAPSNTYTIKFNGDIKEDKPDEDKDTDEDTDDVKFPLSSEDENKYYHETRIDTNGTFYDVFKINNVMYDILGNEVKPIKRESKEKVITAVRGVKA